MKNILIYSLFLFASQTIYAQYKEYSPCSFAVSLPINFKLINEYPEENNPDECHYIVKSKSGLKLIEINSSLNSRFEENNIKALYKRALTNSNLNITYKIQKLNYFVISGTDKTNGNIVYWKRIFGDNFISDLYIKYSKNQKNEIEPYLTKMSTSFTSK